MSEKLRRLNPNTIHPIGQLKGIFDLYDAPVDARTAITRRAGFLSGTVMLPSERITDAIEDTMQRNGGQPQWKVVEDKVGMIVRDAYKKMRR